MDLFDQQLPADLADRQPLAARMRPQTLEEVIGQDHLLAPGKLLRRAIESDRLGSLILYGPPGCGKTSLAEVIARITRRNFERVSGVLANVAVLRDLLQAAYERRKRHVGSQVATCPVAGRRGDSVETILFIDEIHHFNKSQQDILLPYVENGVVTLIGATTHNPFFFVNSPLTSRSQIFELEPISEDGIIRLLRRALTEPRGLAAYPVAADDAALAHLARTCEGDARRALNALEIAVLTTPPDAQGQLHITRAITEDSIQKKAVIYDHDEDGHYDTISAFIKSVRGSDPHAAVYWLAKMLYAGEDPRFIARRLIILASEDIGNADPRGLLVAEASKNAVEFVGMPEARIILSQATTYLACAPKSNAAYLAIEKASNDIKEGRVLPVPKPLRGTGYRGAKQLGHTGYQYAHDFKGHVVDQEYIPTSAVYYEPTTQGYEEVLQQRLKQWEKIKQDQQKMASSLSARVSRKGTKADEQSPVGSKRGRGAACCAHEIKAELPESDSGRKTKEKKTEPAADTLSTTHKKIET
ncbi:MAG: replication-associated recombination protein A [Verrucomicrobia bacterium]|nr:replication-associated recombination protein A [Verrucomicrobiota bacterium]MCG2679920.1 replication-associated recombination protein A [Kiritimatiellia bacterium]MBU4247264.1 replication-associated recombination protein A [Verrucomicrobiota bacterium]MBU4290545.1 replication-associated recombination protein A [Verrucomicrobiota bacterium]MBU4428505.1 replication-associated recombination protein A [Verrucomicrobiota bacterium]